MQYDISLEPTFCPKCGDCLSGHDIGSDKSGNFYICNDGSKGFTENATIQQIVLTGDWDGIRQD